MPKTTPPSPSNKIASSQEGLDILRGRLTNLSIFIGLLAGFPIFAYKIFRSFEYGYDLSSWPGMAVYSVIAIFAFLGDSIDYRLRAGISISLMFLVSFFGLSHLGFVVSAFIASLASSILAIFILGRSNGMLFALFSCGIGMIVILVFSNLNLSLEMESLDAFQIISKWWPQLIAILAFYFALAVSISMFESSLKRTVRQLQFQKRELQVLNKELTKSRDLAEKGNEAKSQFISVMSHELKTPLNPVFGLLNLLKEEPLNQDSLEYVSMMENSSKHLLSIIDEILDYIELDKDDVATEMQPIAVMEMCESVISSHTGQARNKGIGVTTSYLLNNQADHDIEVINDPKRLVKILDQLVSNAIKFTESGTVSFSAKTIVGDAGKSKLEFTVNDTGPGIPQELHSEVFEPFFQVEDSNTRKEGGIGLGLCIAEKISRLLSGELKLVSSTNEGSTFRLIVPCILSSKDRIGR